MLEAQHVAGFVFDALVADAAFSSAVGGRIYREQIPQAASLPAAIVGPVVSAVDATTLGGVRVLANVQVDVHLVGSGASYGPITPAAERADAVLSNLGGTNAGVFVVELRRDAVQAYLENAAGVTYVHLIQTFRTEAHAAP
jgi:hypothetical protein